jgi:hypothetical protein
MAINFPTSLDNFTNPSASDTLDSPTAPHATQHSDLNDAVEALQAKVGADSSAVTTSHDYKIADHASRLTTLEALGSIQTYTPTWTAAGGTPTIGNGTLTGKYTVINNWCVGSVLMVLGSTSSISGTSEWRWSLPVTQTNTPQFQALGSALAIDYGTAGYRGTVWYSLGQNAMAVYASDGAPTVGATTPFTWTPASGDYLTISFSYEVA